MLKAPKRATDRTDIPIGLPSAGKDEPMQKTLLLFASVAAGAVALAAPISKAMPLARATLGNGVQQAHAVRICDDEGDCWWSYRHHHGYSDEDRDHGWRHGYRYHDEDHYGRSPRYRDEYEERSEYRDHGHYGRGSDHERGEMNRERQSMDRDHDREHSAREESRERNKDYRSEHEMKERSGHSESKKD
jgi:hypothetical protein